MKKLVKQKWFPFIVALTLVVALLGFLYHIGFRITYAPELENSWDAISACAAWAGVFVSAIGVVASFVAIWFAIRVPKKIAEQQDKIALFEKRYDCYSVIQNLLVSAEEMKDADTNKGVQIAFRAHLGHPEEICKNINAAVFALQLKQNQITAVSGEFLFQNYNAKLLQEIIDVGVELITNTAEWFSGFEIVPLSSEAIQLKTKYCELCKKYADTYIESMEQELQLYSNK